MRATLLLIAGFCGHALAVGACAIANTPQQDLAYERWARCSKPYTQLEWVALDGQIAFLFSNDADRQVIDQCLASASRTGPPLPPPVGIRPRGGP